MCKQMILTVFLIAGTLGTISELQIRIILVCSSADHASMAYILLSCSLNLFVVISPPLHLLR